MLELFLMAYCEHCLLVLPFLSSLFWEQFTVDLCPGAVITLAQHSKEMAKVALCRSQWSHSCHLTQHRSICNIVNTASTSAAPSRTCLQCKCLSSSTAASLVTDHNVDLCGGWNSRAVFRSLVPYLQNKSHSRGLDCSIFTHWDGYKNYFSDLLLQGCSQQP